MPQTLSHTTAGSRLPLSELIDALVHVLGHSGVVEGDAVDCRTTSDWSAAPRVKPQLLLTPHTTQQVAAVMKLCHENGYPIVIQGGLTGLAGGANPQEGEIALSLARMNAIEAIDGVSGAVVVQAGVTLEALQEAVAGCGWSFPLDLGARGSCQLGGNAATNAGGNRVLRYGTMRNLVRGLEVVLPDGTVLDMLDSVIKNNAGFDLKQLFIGSEGTLGVITRLSLGLVPLATGRNTVLCAVRNFRDALALLSDAKRLLPELSAFEVMWDDFFEASVEELHKPRPFAERYPIYVLIETLGPDAATAGEAIERLLEEGINFGTVCDAIIAQSVAQAGELWAFREAVSELLSRLKPCAAFDVSVSLSRMGALVSWLRQSLEKEFPGRQHLFFGHLGDGNLHLMSGPFADAAELEKVEEHVYAVVGNFGGSISAEHGIGVVKRPFLHHCRGGAEIALMRSLKATLDPRGILNRGRVFA